MVFVIGIKFWERNNCIVVLVRGIFVCVFVIVLIIDLGFIFNGILMIFVCFVVIINFIVWCWKDELIIIIVYVFGLRFCILYWLLGLVCIIVIIILLLLIIWINVFGKGVFDVVFVIIFWIVLGLGVNVSLMVDEELVIILMDVVLVLKLGSVVIIV